MPTAMAATEPKALMDAAPLGASVPVGAAVPEAERLAECELEWAPDEPDAPDEAVDCAAGSVEVTTADVEATVKDAVPSSTVM